MVEGFFVSVVAGLAAGVLLLLAAAILRPIRDLIRYSVDRFEIDVGEEMLPAQWTVSVADGFFPSR